MEFGGKWRLSAIAKKCAVLAYNDRKVEIIVGNGETSGYLRWISSQISGVSSRRTVLGMDL